MTFANFDLPAGDRPSHARRVRAAGRVLLAFAMVVALAAVFGALVRATLE